MKRLFVSLVFAALMACEKQEVQPVVTWYLDFSTVGVNVWDLPACHIAGLYNNGLTGEMLFFEQDDFKAVIARLSSGEVVQIEGAIAGKTFIVINGRMNICGGNQQQTFNYKIERK